MSALVVAAGAGVAAGALLQSATGFGFSLVAAPLVFAAIEPEQAVGLLIVLGTEVNVLTLASERRTPRPLWRRCAVLLAWAAPGALLGVVVLKALPPVGLQVAVTLGVLGTLAARHAAGRHLHVPAWVAGFSAGALTTSTTTAGPPMLLHLLGSRVSPEQVRDTLTVSFLGLSVLGVVALAVTGTPAVPDALLVAALLPAVALGHLIGRRVFARLAAGGRYEPVLNVVLVLAVLVGMASVLA
jgi:uncharacterized membrane protein YfcA